MSLFLLHCSSSHHSTAATAATTTASKAVKRRRHAVLLKILLLLLHFLVHLKLIAGSEHFVIDCGLLSEVSLHKQSGSVKSVAKLALHLLPVENVPDLVAQLSIAQEQVLPLREAKDRNEVFLLVLLVNFTSKLVRRVLDELGGEGVHMDVG